MASTMTQALDDLDQALLAEAQQRVPMVHRPFEVLGERLRIPEQECLVRFSRLKHAKAIERVSAVFDAASLGYHVTLVAMRADPERIDTVADVICRHPGVAHLESRSDPLNLWFTVGVPPGDSLERMTATVCQRAGVDEALLLPVLRWYKHSDVAHAVEAPSEVPRSIETQTMTSRLPLSAQDIRLIRLFQEDLPAIELPFTVWAEQVEMTEDALFAWARRMEHLGYLQRFSAALAPPTADNAGTDVMWQVPEQDIDAIGEEIARFHDVVSCARRPQYATWPYPLVARLRAEDATACLEMAKRIATRVGTFPHKMLFRVREYCRRRVIYFSPELDRWWSEAGKSTI